MQSDGSVGSWLGNFGKKALTDHAIPLARNNVPQLVSILAVRAGKGFTLLISNEDMNDIIKII